MSQSVMRTKVSQSAFVVAAGLPSPDKPGRNAGFVAMFAYCKTVETTQVTTSYRFTACSQSLSRETPDPVNAFSKRAQTNRTTAFVFEQQTTRQTTTTISVMYFAYVCQKSARADGGGAALRPPPAPAPMLTYPRTSERRSPDASAGAPAASPVRLTPPPSPPRAQPSASDIPTTERRGTTATPKSVEPSRNYRTVDWQDLAGVKHKAARYDVWNALGEAKPREIEVSLKDRSGKSRICTPQEIAADGLSFTVLGSNEAIRFEDVDQLRVR
jgi:hypothetical protein